MSCGIKLNLDNIIRVGQKEEQEKAVTPTKEQQVVLPDTSKTLSKVIVKPIPDDYIIPSGELEINEQGVFDVTQYKTANVKAPFEPKFAQLINGTITEINAQDLEGSIKVNDYAFYNQSYLGEVNLPISVERIGNNAFNGCSSLRFINTEKIYYLGVYAFANCSILEELNVQNITNIGNGEILTSNDRLTKLKFDKLVSGIGNYAFVSCNGLRFVRFLNLTKIKATNAFSVYRNSYNRTYRFDSLIAIPILDTAIPHTARVFVLNSPNVVTLNTTAHQNNITKYVPLNLIETYKTETNWVANPNTIYPSVANEQERLALNTTLYKKCYQNDTDQEFWFENGGWVLKYTEGLAE